MKEMKYGSIEGISKPVSRLVHGTIMLSIDNVEEGYQLLDDMYSLGVNTFDTAAAYPNGSEAVLLRWIAERGNHDNVVVLSKCAHPNQWRERVTPFDIRTDITDSLAKSGTDYLDIYMLHRDNRCVEVGPIIETLNALQAEKKITVFGASNWETDRIEMANEYAYKHGLQSFSAISPHYSLGEQVENPWEGSCVTLTGNKEEAARKKYIQNQLPVFSYSTLCRGLFSGAFTSDNEADARKVLDGAAQKGYLYECNLKRLARVEALAKELNTSVPCIALAWVLQQPLNVYALIGAENKRIMEENMNAFKIQLTDKQLKWLNLEND